MSRPSDPEGTGWARLKTLCGLPSDFVPPTGLEQSLCCMAGQRWLGPHGPACSLYLIVPVLVAIKGLTQQGHSTGIY